MRKKAETRKKPTGRKKQSGIDRSPESTLQDRFSRLEERVSDIEEHLRREGILPRVDFSESKKKPGPRQKISDDFLFELRDGLVLWLERVWPELDSALRKARTVKEATGCLEKFANPKETRTQYQDRLIGNVAALLDYRATNKLARIPPKQTVVTAIARAWTEPEWKAAARFPTRRMANAMAGVPQLDWRTSFDRCAKLPSRMPLGSRTTEHYRRRYSLPAYYVLESVASGSPHWSPVAGPLYSLRQAKAVVANRQVSEKIACIKSEGELKEMGLDADKVFSTVTGLPAIPKRVRTSHS
jgi:hypothetical protein